MKYYLVSSCPCPSARAVFFVTLSMHDDTDGAQHRDADPHQLIIHILFLLTIILKLRLCMSSTNVCFSS